MNILLVMGMYLISALMASPAFAGWGTKEVVIGKGPERNVLNEKMGEKITVERHELKKEDGGRQEYEVKYKNSKAFESQLKIFDKDNNLVFDIVNYLESNASSTKEYFPNGTLKVDKSYKNNKLDGLLKEYWESNGNLKFICNYRAGEKNGLCKEYSEDKKPKLEAEYKNGKFSGSYKEFYPSGQQKIKSRYEKDKLHGKFQEYYENGKPRTEGVYAKGLKSGLFNEYSPEGILIWKGAYKNGNLDGKIIEYDNFGKIKGEAHYKNGILHGFKKEYYENGILKYQAEYSEGLRNGVEQAFFSNGQIQKSTKYFNNKLFGQSKEFFPNGKLKKESNYQEGLMHGLLNEYNEQGFLQYRARHEQGLLEGKEELYDTEGRLIQLAEYKKDTLLGVCSFDLVTGQGITSLVEIFNEHSIQKDDKKPFKEHFPDGGIKEEINYGRDLNGIEDAVKEYKEYHKPGILKYRILYLKDDLQGMAESYDEEGQLIHKMTFDQGRIDEIDCFDPILSKKIKLIESQLPAYKQKEWTDRQGRYFIEQYDEDYKFIRTVEFDENKRIVGVKDIPVIPD